MENERTSISNKKIVAFNSSCTKKYILFVIKIKFISCVVSSNRLRTWCPFLYASAHHFYAHSHFPLRFFPFILPSCIILGEWLRFVYIFFLLIQNLHCKCYKGVSNSILNSHFYEVKVFPYAFDQSMKRYHTMIHQRWYCKKKNSQNLRTDFWVQDSSW